MENMSESIGERERQKDGERGKDVGVTLPHDLGIGYPHSSRSKAATNLPHARILVHLAQHIIQPAADKSSSGYGSHRQSVKDLDYSYRVTQKVSQIIHKQYLHRNIISQLDSMFSSN